MATLAQRLAQEYNWLLFRAASRVPALYNKTLSNEVNSQLDLVATEQAKLEALLRKPETRAEFMTLNGVPKDAKAYTEDR